MNTFFVLIAVLHLNSGNDKVYAIDTGMTGEDCIYAIIELQDVVANNVTLSCEIDYGFQQLPIDVE